MLITELPTKSKEPIMENDDQINAIKEARANEQIEAAGAHAAEVHHNLMNALEDHFEYEKVKKDRSRAEIVKGYLLEEWTWLTTLEDKVNAEEDVPAPDHCAHIDPLNPTVWIGMLAQPNTLYCMECAMDQANKDVSTGQELCDRCHTTNESGEFYEFVMPIVNIQFMGSICKSCLDKV
jgi:hypothetical protein